MTNFMLLFFRHILSWRVMRYGFVLLGFLAVLDCFYLFFAYHILHLGVALPCVLGLIFCGHGLFWQKIDLILKQNKLIQRIWTFFWLGFCAWLCSFLIFVFYLQFSLNHQQNFINQPVKAIIVLGSGFRNGKPTPVLASRLDKSAEIAQKNPDAVMILTGGIGFNKTVSEASVMRTYLQEHYHLPVKNMLLEDKSTSTELNLQNSKPLLVNRGVSLDSQMMIVTSDFHTLRAVAIAKKQGFVNVMAVGADTPLYVRYHNWLREYFAFLSGWFLGEY